jgi:hypothetical protein
LAGLSRRGEKRAPTRLASRSIQDGSAGEARCMSHYYTREISVFFAGYVVGMSVFIAFSKLNAAGMPIPAWWIATTAGTALTVLLAASRFLRFAERINAEDADEQPGRDADISPAIAKQETPPLLMPSPPDSGITFSHSTKALQVAQAASIKYWSDYDPLRPPLQKQITAFMIERGVPARQAAELAIAIKPDDLP